jgi:hypothetical protein
MNSPALLEVRGEVGATDREPRSSSRLLDVRANELHSFLEVTRRRDDPSRHGVRSWGAGGALTNAQQTGVLLGRQHRIAAPKTAVLR